MSPEIKRWRRKRKRKRHSTGSSLPVVAFPVAAVIIALILFSLLIYSLSACRWSWDRMSF